MSRVLLVEDNVDLAYGLQNNLEIEGYDVRVAEKGEVGLDLAQAWDPDLRLAQSIPAVSSCASSHFSPCTEERSSSIRLGFVGGTGTRCSTTFSSEGAWPGNPEGGPLPSSSSSDPLSRSGHRPFECGWTNPEPGRPMQGPNVEPGVANGTENTSDP